MQQYYLLVDTFNKKVLSRHTGVANCKKENERFQRAVKRANGMQSYIPTAIYSPGEVLPREFFNPYS